MRVRDGSPRGHVFFLGLETVTHCWTSSSDCNPYRSMRQHSSSPKIDSPDSHPGPAPDTISCPFLPDCTTERSLHATHIASIAHQASGHLDAGEPFPRSFIRFLSARIRPADREPARIECSPIQSAGPVAAGVGKQPEVYGRSAGSIRRT